MKYTVGHEITNIIVRFADDRRRKLIMAGAPEIVIKPCDDLVTKAHENVAKLVGGMSRKYKGVADEEIIEAIQFIQTTGDYYKEGKQDTRIFRFVTESGIYYYDTFDRKIEKVNEDGLQYGLSVRVSEKDFEK